MLKYVFGAYLSRLVGAFPKAVFFFLPCLVHAQTSEFRGLWADAWNNGFFDAAQTTRLIADARAYNFNAIVVQMRRRGDAFYTPLAGNDPKTTAISPSYDALADIIAKAHTGLPRIEVHCWVTTHVIWGDGTLPSNPAHVVNLHPEYLMKDSVGSTLMAEGLYLDPGHPEAARWNFTMATNIVRRYDIDGFHWDYIRYPQQDSGYNDTAVARYNAEYGLSGQPATNSAQFSTWRRRQVTDFMRWANAEILGVKSNIVISASVFGSRSDAYTYRFQDWAAWNTEGLLDVCVPMGYTSDNNLFMSRVSDAFNNQGVRRVYYGVGAYLNTRENTVWQMGYIRSKPLSGSCFYSYANPNSGTVDQAGTLSYVRDNFQPAWLSTPSLPWKASPATGIIKGYLTSSDSNAPVYNATVKIFSLPQRTILSEAHGHYAFFEAAPGTYNITATAAGFGSVTNLVTVSAGGIAHQNLVIPVTDTTAPVISGVAATLITSSNAVIVWETDDMANAAVDFGNTSLYGSTTSNATPVMSHSITLTNLIPGTNYYYRVRSRNASSLSTTSAEFGFTTIPVNFPDVIIESRLDGGTKNSDPPYQEVGSWSDSSVKSTAPGLSGAGSRFSGSHVATYSLKPSLPVGGGGYDVYLTHHGQPGSVSSNIVVGVSPTGGAGLPATTTIFQAPDGNTWEYLGRITLSPGVSNPVVTFSYGSGDVSSSPGQRWYSDSAKFVYMVPPPAPPAIVSGPLDKTVVQGSNATFAVTASGAAPLGYRWRHQGSFISGATQSTHTVQSAQPTQEGEYTVVVTNVAGSVTSAPALLAVIEPPVIVGPPASQTVIQGQDATFIVTVGGTGPFFYQWRFNGVPISDATGSAYTRAAVINTHQGSYTVAVTNAAAGVTSAPALLTVTYPSAPAITSVEALPVSSIRLQLSGGPGQFKIEASPDLGSWSNRATLTATNAAFEYEDSTSAGSRLFYRLKRDP
jgi:uncharacterized lipoprotein YddW (UPF0748 family)